jgi:hypothetical protein
LVPEAGPPFRTNVDCRYAIEAKTLTVAARAAGDRRALRGRGTDGRGISRASTYGVFLIF